LSSPEKEGEKKVLYKHLIIVFIEDDPDRVATSFEKKKVFSFHLYSDTELFIVQLPCL
jgi:hypothetical protein